MSKILSVKRWFDASYEVDEEHTITLQVKRLMYQEANRLLVVTTEAFGALSSAREEPKSNGDGAARALTQAEQVEFINSNAKAAEMFYQALRPETMEWVWRDCVRNVAGIEDEDGPVTTGEKLSTYADQRMVMWLLTQLGGHASLTSTEGKASSSPSTLGSEGQTSPYGSGASPAHSTEPADGSSTAPATQN